ncbi:MAG: CBS domain-containing protein [Candidatus Omnitrophota bacterium]
MNKAKEENSHLQNHTVKDISTKVNESKQRRAFHPKDILVNDIMSDIVVTIPENYLVSQAAHLMLRDRVNGLLVVDQAHAVVGMLTLTDLFTIVDQAASDQHYDFYKSLFHEKEAKVTDVMTKNVCSVTPEMTLAEVIRLTLRKNIHTFPVVKDGKLVGVIGRHDVLNAIFTF